MGTRSHRPLVGAAPSEFRFGAEIDTKLRPAKRQRDEAEPRGANLATANGSRRDRQTMTEGLRLGRCAVGLVLGGWATRFLTAVVPMPTLFAIQP